MVLFWCAAGQFAPKEKLDRYADVEQDRMRATGARTVWRSRSQLVAGVGFGLFLAVVGLTQVGKSASKGGGIGFTVVAFVLAAAMIAIFARGAVVTSDEGVRVRNPFRTIVIPWSDVAGFRIGRHRMLSAVCIVDLADGSSQYAFGIQMARSPLGRAHSKEQRMIDLLNEMVVTHQGAASQRR